MSKFLRFPTREIFFTVALIVTIVSTAFLLYQGKSDLIPQLWISTVAAILSYWACTFTADKMRLDLFDRRFEIYSKTLTYCSVVGAYASLAMTEKNRDEIDKAVSAAHESFRGIGYHKTRALFGEDIASLFKQLNESYAYIATFGSDRARGQDFDAKAYFEHVTRTVDLAHKLPDHFRPYMYFGDYKLG